MAILARLKQLYHAWNAFKDQDPNQRTVSYAEGMTFGVRPDRSRLRWSNERSIISAIFTRISIDASKVDVRHVRLDESNRYLEDIDSGLNNCLTVEANLDQAARQFRQDIFLTLFDKGCAAIVPVDTTINPSQSAGFDIKTLRVGEITAWMPQHVRVSLYNEAKGRREEITLEKKYVGIVENPLYAVMNEPNSTLQRLIKKLNLLDAVDEQSSSGRLDLIIQLPYVVKSEARRTAATQRRQDLEAQLRGSQYGVAYVDGTEKVIQLNRPAENNLLKQVEYLVNMLYGQLGLTPEVMNGTADEGAMLNYRERTIEPLVTAMVEAMIRSFLSRTARSQRQSILYFFNPFKLAQLKDMAEIADKFTRNEIVTSNEFRAFLGIPPSKDPKADELRNSNMPEPTPVPSETNQLQPTS
jgi:portal protein